MKYSLRSLEIILILCIVITLLMFRAELPGLYVPSMLTDGDVVLEVEEISAWEGWDERDEYFREHYNIGLIHDAALSDLLIYYSGEELNFSAILTYGENIVPLETSGALHKVRRIHRQGASTVTGAGSIYAQMESDDNIRFVQFVLLEQAVIEADNSEYGIGEVLIITLQTYDTGEVVQFRPILPEGVFELLYNTVENRLSHELSRQLRDNSPFKMITNE